MTSDRQVTEEPPLLLPALANEGLLTCWAEERGEASQMCVRVWRSTPPADPELADAEDPDEEISVPAPPGRGRLWARSPDERKRICSGGKRAQETYGFHARGAQETQGQGFPRNSQ